jgi:alkanesulfonate monooxygenase SsuD/methylene tetrahydromethanopterin reductase-like flavin-dependent oxidoreductase (luciferase family)
VLDPWRAEVASAGGDPSQRRVGIIRPWLITDDKARDWPAIREAERYKARIYAGWIRESGDAVSFMSGEETAIPQTWMVGDAESVTEQLGAFIAKFGFTDVVTWAAPPGIAPEALDASLERFARDVMPRLKAMRA